ncbi:MAG: response regulator [Myxococcota bacterium]|jgi:DNA-binding NtrC family response regulator|nr:response regulator [Myxococcota bacterium]
MAIVIVEDDPMLRRALTRAMRSMEVSVKIVTTVEQALEHIEQEPIRILLTDYSLGEGEDTSLLLRRTRELLPNCEIFVMTGHELPSLVLDRALYDKYIQKPFSLRNLREMLNTSLERTEAAS